MHKLVVFFVSIQQNYHSGKWEVTEIMKFSMLRNFLLFYNKDFMQLIGHQVATGFQTPT